MNLCQLRTSLISFICTSKLKYLVIYFEEYSNSINMPKKCKVRKNLYFFEFLHIL